MTSEKCWDRSPSSCVNFLHHSIQTKKAVAEESLKMIIFLSLLAFLPPKCPQCLSKVKIGEKNNTLSLSDILELILGFSKDSLRWISLGNTKRAFQKRHLQMWQWNQTPLQLIYQNPWRTISRQVAKAILLNKGVHPEAGLHCMFLKKYNSGGRNRKSMRNHFVPFFSYHFTGSEHEPIQFLKSPFKARWR